MAYTPVNVDAYTNAYSGALAGMAISGWIVDPTSADYSNVAAIAGAFAQAFDTVWNNATTLNWLQIQSIQSVCQEQFAGHAPGSLDNAVFTQASNWAVPAAACAALVLEGDAFVASEGITPNTPGGGSSNGPIFRQLWLDTSKPDGGDGSIATPYNLWANAVAPLEGSGGAQPWLIQIAQDIDASGVPIPNIGAGGHDTGHVKLLGPTELSAYTANGVSITGLEIAFQDGGDVQVDIDNLLILGLTFDSGVSTLFLTGQNSRIIGVNQSGTVSGATHFINCSIDELNLDSIALRMYGGTLEGNNQIGEGFLFDVEFLDSCALRWNGTLFMSNCTFKSGVQLQCSSNNPLQLDLDTWGSMRASGVTFPDTTPTLNIVPWMPVLADKAVVSTDGINPNSVATLDVGTLTPAAERSKGCIANFSIAVNSNLSVVGAFIDSSGHLNVLVKNSAGTTQNLVNPTYTVTYLPQVTP
jgi:hypothetical protein